MSMDDADTRRKQILRLVRKSAATDCETESLQESDEHRKKFLDCRKQFEAPPPPIDQKPPFFPHWINADDDTELSVTYKKKGAEITDLRINYVNNNDGNNNEIGKDSNKSADRRENTRILENRDSTVNGNSKLTDHNLLYSQDVNINVFRNREDTNSSSITRAPYLHDENALGKSGERAKRLMDRNSRSNKSIKQSQTLRIIEETSLSMSSKSIATLESNRIVNTPRTVENILCNYSIPRKTIVCRPIVRKLIELKKYDHIVTNVISNT